MKARIHVDYLSHDWEANDVICAHTQIYKQIRAMKTKLNKDPENKSILVEYQRLNRYQNALWRQMSRTCTSRLGKQNHLVHPSTVNWQKESDITWLYGPLYTNDNDEDEITMTTSMSSTTTTTTSHCHNNNNTATSIQRQQDLKPVLKSSIYVRRRRQGLIGDGSAFGSEDHALNEDRIPSFSSIASTSSSTSTVLPPPTPTNSTGVRFSPESTKIQYFIPESPVQEFLEGGDYYTTRNHDYMKESSWNPYWSYESDEEDHLYGFDDDEDDDQEDDDLWELMVGVTHRIKNWFIPPRRKQQVATNNTATTTTTTTAQNSNSISSSSSRNVITTTTNNGNLLDLVFTLISITKSVASLMATWVVYQGLVRMLWVVRRPAIRNRQQQQYHQETSEQHYFQLKHKDTNHHKILSSSSKKNNNTSSSS